MNQLIKSIIQSTETKRFCLSTSQVKKIQDKRDKSTHDTNKTKDKYESCLEDINEHNPRYIEDMTVQFKKAQDYERKRLQFFKEALIAAHKVLDLSVNDKWDFSPFVEGIL